MLLKVIAVVGPTASGKSALGAFLAQKVNGEVVSADSRQVYKGMKITSRAAIGAMVGVVDPKKTYNTGEFMRDAARAIHVIHSKNKVPIVVGGTGFYIDALLGRMHIPPVPPNPKLRKLLEKKSVEQLFEMLQKLDRARASNIEPGHKRRLIRAIEISRGRSRTTRSKCRTWPSGPERTSEGSAAEPYSVLWFGVKPSASIHAKNIRAGVEERLRRGMVAEVKKLRLKLGKKRFAALGFEFTFIADHLDKKISRTVLAEKLAREEAKYAKRQMRWFKRNDDIHWVKNKNEALWFAKKFLKPKTWTPRVQVLGRRKRPGVEA